MNNIQSEEDLFLAALEITDSDERAAYLDAACAEDAELRRRVETLLRRHQESAGPLDAPPPGFDATIEQPSIIERPGTVIGPYKLLEQIGEGGFGVVFMAEQQRPVRRRVALKIIKPGMDTRQVIARFEAERQALALMDHANIAKVLDAGATETGRPYFVMELVKGFPITEYCDQQHLTPRERLELFIPVCQAVQHAHQKGIIHRDLKPSNILVAQYDDQAIPKIIDFGVAKATQQRLTERTLFTQHGQVVGTIEYMSPEQAQLNQLDVDTRCDIYSLGVLLYELLTGETPFDRERLRSAAFDEMLRVIREEEPPRPSLRLSTSQSLPSIAANRMTEPRKLSALVHGELDWILMKTLEKDRSRRYETASNFAEDIQHYLDDEAVTACPPSAAYRFRKFARRNKAALTTTAAILLLLLVGVVSTTWQAMRATREKDRAVRAENVAQDARQQAEDAQRAESAQLKMAEEQRELAQQKELTARRRLYTSHMTLIEQALANRNTGRVLDLLELQRPRNQERDLRGFEWYCLWRICHQGHLLTLRGHEESIHSVAFSPDGTKLASASQDGTVRLWDAQTGKQTAVLLNISSPCQAVAFTPDGTSLASGGNDGTIWLWDLATGRQGKEWQGHQESIQSVVFSPEGNVLATGSGDKTVKLWDVTTGGEIPSCLQTLELKNVEPNSPGIHSVAFSSDGGRVAAGAGGWNDVRIWDFATGEQLHRLRGHMLTVYTVAFSPDGQILATGGYDQTVKLWDVSTGEVVATLNGQTGRVRSLSFSPDGTILAAGTGDGTVALWDITTREELPNLLGHQASVSCVAFSPTGKTLASAGGDNCIKLWDITKWQSPTIVRPSQTTCWALAFSPDSKDLAFVHKIPNGLLHFWDVASGQVRRTLSTANALGLAYSADGGTLAATHVAGLRFIDLSTGQETNVPVAATREIAFSPDGTLVATGSEEHTVKLWDLITGRPLKPLAGHTNEVPGVKFSPDGRILASASQDKTVKLWDVATWEERATLQGHKGCVWSIAFTADGKSLISAGGDIKVWDIDTAKERLTLHRKTGSYHAWHLALSPDGKTLATTSSNPASLTFWDTASWQERATFRWHPAIIRAIQFSPDGSMLATGAEDNTVTLWSAATEAEVRAQSSVLDKSEKR